MSTEGQVEIRYPDLADEKMKARIQKQLKARGLDKPGPDRQVIQVVVLEGEPTKKKKKGIFRRCGKWFLCLPVTLCLCSGNFCCKRAKRCLTCPCRCLCPCC